MALAIWRLIENTVKVSQIPQFAAQAVSQILKSVDSLHVFLSFPLPSYKILTGISLFTFILKFYMRTPVIVISNGGVM